MKYLRYIPIIALMIIAAFTRFIPHPFNFTAIGAMALFGGATIRDKRLAFLLPFLVMIVTDYFIGFHRIMFPVYLSLSLTVMLGIAIQNRRKPLVIGMTSVASSVLFFLITNLPFWFGTRYPNTIGGAVESYTLALPFFWNQLAGDLFYSAVLFIAFALIEVRFPSLAKQN